MDTWLNILFDASIFVYSNNLIVVHFTKCSHSLFSFSLVSLHFFPNIVSFTLFSFFRPPHSNVEREIGIEREKMIASARALIRAIDTFYNFLSHGLLLRRENTQRERKNSLIGSMNISLKLVRCIEVSVFSIHCNSFRFIDWDTNKKFNWFLN